MPGIFKALGSIFKNLNLGSLLPWLGSLGAGATAHARNTQLMKQQNAFNAGEAQLNRNFQAQEAALARQWQEDFYLKYQSPQAMVHQYEAAGLNPVLSTGMPTNTPPSASNAHGSMAQGASAPYLDATGIMQQFLGLMKLDAEIKNIKADTADKEQSVIESSSRIDVNKQQLQKMGAEIEKLLKEASTEEERKGLIVAETILKQEQADLTEKETTSLSYDNLKKKWAEEFKTQFGAYPAENAYQAIQAIAKVLFEQLGFNLNFGG